MASSRKRTFLDYFFGPWTLRKGGIDYPERPVLELIAGANITITPVDDQTTDATKVTIAASGGGGGGTPTGTGFYKVVGGVMQAAAEPVDLADATERTGILPLANQAGPTGTGLRKMVSGVEASAAALLVNADVDAAAAIAGTKVSPNFGAQNVITTGYLGLNPTAGTIAVQGAIRLPNNLGRVMAMRNAANSGELVVVHATTTDCVFGANSSLGEAFTNTYFAATTQLAFVVGGVGMMYGVPTAIKLALPIGGMTAPLQLRSVSLTFSGSDITLSAAQSECPILAANNGNGNIIAPNTVGSLYIVPPSGIVRTIKKSGGTGVSCVSNKTTTVYHDGTDYAFLSVSP